jgi:pyrroloquinoline quinone biosynthesis protein B
MRALILGSAAGGGLPQWNCACATCTAARSGGAVPRSQSSIAVRADGGPWLLVNASPDVRQQLELLREPDAPVRSSPVDALLLTDAELDHTIGLLVMREGDRPLAVYASRAVQEALTVAFPVARVLEHYSGIAWRLLEPGSTAVLPGGLVVESFPVPGDPPRYVGADQEPFGVGLTFRDGDASLTYVPAVGSLDAELLARLAASDCALVDGTCWADDELASHGIRGPTATAMGHLPLSGPAGSMQRLRHLSSTRVILAHVNNTNPILVETSPERGAVQAAGLEVAYDGMVIEL